MTFNDDAMLDTSQVGSGGGGKIAAAGGGGVGLLIIWVLFQLLGGGGGTSGLPFDPTDVLSGGPSGGQQVDVSHCKTGADANRDDVCRIVGTVNSVQNYWAGALPQVAQRNYTQVKTIIFSQSTQTGCGQASSATGPFYCPVDQRVYIDASFFGELTSRFGADDGALAQEYVLAHEYGHHIENILGYLEYAQQDRSTGPTSRGVRIELMADCLAGVWANHASTTKDANGRTLIMPLTDDDIRVAISAARAVGDDHIQETLGGGRVNPESWTHGSSDEREKWFLTGYRSGSATSCDTFETDDL